MNTKLTIGAAAMVVGMMFGALGNQAIHAQAGKKVYSISEQTNPPPNLADVRKGIEAAGGHSMYTVGSTPVAVVGEAPKHVGLVEWTSVDAAMKWFKSPGAPKAERRYIVEAEK